MTTKALYTIGYEGMDIDRFIETLKAADVRVLADIRAMAISRKKGFSKTSLHARLTEERIEYFHFVDLGDPKLGREAARAGKYVEFRRVYAKHLRSGEATVALRVLNQTAQKNSVCLMCFERDPATCHRTMIADRLKAQGLAVINLFGDEPGRYVRNAKKFRGSHSRQGSTEPQSEVW